MKLALKPLAKQVIVITGASSGIGLATAYRAAKDGARVVLASRNQAALKNIVERIRADGGRAIYVVTDVTKRDDLEHLAQKAVETYGGFDTWVNNAGGGVYGRLDEVSDEDHRKLFDVNFWGLVNGTQIAAAHFKRKGGAIINLGSVVSDVAFPIQGMYCASKHAIKGFTDAFRMELMEAGAPVSVTLIKPSSIDTPFPLHAKNYLDEEPTLPPPIYQPEDVASAIVYAAEHGGRDFYIGGGGKLLSSLNKRWPSLVDLVSSRMNGLDSSGPVRRPREGALDEPSAHSGQPHGEPTFLVRSSIYTAAQTNPLKALAVAALGGLCLALLTASRPSRSFPRTRRSRA